ncbi:MAG: threonine/serine exporter family protein [Clostridia bacterium]|nr:threonine/serine exporter family protein [Clostridia bacterium]
MHTQNLNKIFTQILDLGEIMLRSGGEVYRVEDTIARLVKAYGASESHVFCIPSNIIVTITIDGVEITHSRRVVNVQTNLELLDRMNDLARKICRETPDAEEFARLIKEKSNVRRYNHIEKILIYAVISSSFAVFFGGSWLDAAASAVAGVVLYFAGMLARAIGGNIVFQDIFCAAISAFFAVIFTRLGFGHDADKIIIGNVMLLIPGVELVNGMRDFITGDIQAGTMHVAEALFLAIAIAVGAAGVLTLMGGAHV